MARRMHIFTVYVFGELTACAFLYQTKTILLAFIFLVLLLLFVLPVQKTAHI